MNPYQQLMMAAMAQQQGAKGPVDVAQNIGHDMLKKKPYNPYGLLQMNGEQKQEDPVKSFDKEFLKDQTE